MKIFMASDHGGLETKEFIKTINFGEINGKKVEIIDCGTNSKDSVHYPVFGKKAVEGLLQYVPEEKGAEQENFAILVCTTGIGMSMLANKYPKIRGALCHFVEEAKMTREHNNANVLCIGQKFTNPDIIEEMVKTFLTTKFEGGRHAERINMF